jgi:ABC-2 type transport system permease protein
MIFAGISAFLGGVYYPVTVFPKFLQVVSYFIPVTYSLRALRFAVLKGYPIAFLKQDISALVIFCIILVPLSMFIFKTAVQRAKKSGSLAFY